MSFVMQADRRWMNAAGVALSLLVIVAIVMVIRSVKRPRADLLDVDRGGVGFDCSRCKMVRRAHGSNFATPRDNSAGCSLDEDECKYVDQVVDLQQHQASDFDGIFPLCANVDADRQLVECCEAADSGTGDDLHSTRLACPEVCFTGAVGGSDPIGWDAVIDRMKNNPAGCFQNLNKATGLV